MIPLRVGGVCTIGALRHIYKRFSLRHSYYSSTIVGDHCMYVGSA